MLSTVLSTGSLCFMKFILKVHHVKKHVLSMNTKHTTVSIIQEIVNVKKIL